MSAEYFPTLGFIGLADALLDYGKKVLLREAKKLPISARVIKLLISIIMGARPII